MDSYFDFIDDPDIDLAMEGIGQKITSMAKDVWAAIKRVLKKILTWFKNMLLNINYFKTARLDEKMSADLMYCLKLAQPRTENYAMKVVPGLLKAFQKARKEDNEDKEDKILTGLDGIGTAGDMLSSLTSFAHELFVAQTDVYETTQNVKKCDAYKRLTGDFKYENKNIKPIPMTFIVSDMKNCNTQITRFNGEVEKAESLSRRSADKYPKFTKTVNKAVKFFQTCVTFYSLRTSILMNYFKAAKVSLNAIPANIKEAIKKNNDGRGKNNKEGKYGKIKIMGITAKEIADAIDNARAAKTYAEYKKFYDEIIKKSGVKPHSIIYGFDKGELLYVEQPKTDVVLDKNVKLYHTSYYGGITELQPKWTTPGGVLFETPRVYFHVTNPLTRFGTQVKSNNHVYVPVKLPSKGYVDKEMARTAIFVETETPIPVKEIDYKEWKALKEVEVGMTDTE